MGLHYHEAIIDLLGIRDRIGLAICPALTEWESRHGVALPASYREWCELNHGEELLELFSNGDSFHLSAPELRRDVRWGPCAEFMSENQENYELAVVLDGSADPAVLYSWTKGHRVPYAPRFSDYVFTQVFDWYRSLDDPDRAEGFEAAGLAGLQTPGTYRAMTFEVRYSEDLLDHLSPVPNRGPTTHFYVDDEIYTEHRFWASPVARIRVIVNETKGTALIHAFGTEAVHPLYADLKDRLAGRITRIVWEPAAADGSDR